MTSSYDLQHMPKVLAIYLKLSEYPLLAPTVRERMRQELFARGVISAEQFDREVSQRAISTQEQEGLSDPLVQESAVDWARRLDIVRDHMTDFYFAFNLPHELFEKIVRSTLSARRPEEDIILTFNPELAPWQILFAQAEEYDKLPPRKKTQVRHHLQQIIVVLIRGMISDQLDFIGVAREHLNIHDLKEIYARRIGRGKVGGKAAGMLLAHKILQAEDPEDPLPIAELVTIPNSYFVGADVFYDFVAHNELFSYFDQKYKTREEIEADYPMVRRLFTAGEFPPEVVDRLSSVVEALGSKPLIVRSSSLLEDNFGKAFAGKYESIFCPNQGTPEENLSDLLAAIKSIYASTLHPDPLFYRRKMGLIDYDERMAILIQEVQGAPYGRYFFPSVAGVGFGRNPFRWTPRIRREDGFLRIVWGLGTRAVDRVANDYPRMVALSHPHLRPEVEAQQITRYAQHFVDVIDMEEGLFKTIPVQEMDLARYPSVELLASINEGDFVHPMQFRTTGVPAQALVLTFDRLLQDRTFITLIRAILKKLERAYGRPVDIEFTVEIQRERGQPRFLVHLLQCRPLSTREDMPTQEIPPYIQNEDILFTSTKLVPEGIVRRIEYVVYIDPHKYARIPDYSSRFEIARVVGRLNKKLAGQCFILIGPGRWGSSNVDLGVKVSYADIYNTAMLIEMAFAGAEGTPEVSYGTHFFQDLIEADIYPLPIFPDAEGTTFNQPFIDEAHNVLADLLPKDAPCADYVKVIDLRRTADGRLLEVIMNAEEEKAVGYLRSYAE